MAPAHRILLYLPGACALLASVLLPWAGFGMGVTMVAFASLAALQVAVVARVTPHPERVEVEPAEQGAVMSGAETFVSEFEAAGFEHVGAFRWNLRGRIVIETVLASSVRDCYAIATDRILEVASRFRKRTLITINGGDAPLHADILRQEIHGGPTALVEAHQGALDLLEELGLRPDRFRDDAELLRAVREADEPALNSGATLSLWAMLRLKRERDVEGELRDDEESRRRIQAWQSGGAH